MILYHPVHDPHHAAYRMLRLLSAHKDHSLPYMSLRILDYFLLFPAEIEHIQMPTALRAWKTKFREHKNKYFSNVSKHSAFRQLAGPQELGLRLLHSRGVISDIAGDGDFVTIETLELPEGLSLSIQTANEFGSELIHFLACDLASIELSGPMGLKKRTGLVEYRYDVI